MLAAPDAAKPMPVTAHRREPSLGGAQTAAIVLSTSVAVVMLNVAPLVEPSLQRDAHFSAGDAGAAFSVELAAMGLTSIPAAAWIGRSGAVRVARWAYAVFIAGSLLSAPALNSFAQYAAARGVAGIGAGMLMVLGMSLAARAGDPDRLYALITFAQLASGAAMLAGLAALTDAGPVLNEVLLASTALGALGIATAGRFNGAGAMPPPTAPPPAAARSDRHLVALALTFALVFNLVVGAVWPFAAAYAPDMASARVAQVLAGATVAGLAGAALALLVGNRVPRRRSLVAGYLGIALGAGVLHFARHPLGFAAGCCVFSLAWNFSVPYVFAAVASRDRTGTLMGVASLAFAAGLALGPLLAGAVLNALGLDALFPALLPGLAIGIVLTLRITSRSKA